MDPFQFVTCLPHYMPRAVSSLEPDLGKAVVSDFVRTLCELCPHFVRATVIAIVCTCSTCLFIILSQITGFIPVIRSVHHSKYV